MPRPSPVRDAVRRQLQTANRHSWSVEEMLGELRTSSVAADFSTVFRALVWCEQRKLVQRLDVGDGRSRYELIGEHHEHARCERCGTVVEVPGCQLEDAASRLRALTGYRVTGHQLVFTGLCPSCQ